MRERSRARAWALQILYAWDTRGGESSVPDILDDFLRERTIAAESLPYVRQLVLRFAEGREEVDRAVDAALTNWRLGRLSVIDRNVLRLGATELLFFDDVPPAVAIQEAIRLAEKYGTAESPRFVNGVLDALLRHRPGRERE